APPRGPLQGSTARRVRHESDADHQQARDESQDDLQSSARCQAYQLQVTAGGNDSSVESRQTVVMIGLGVRDTPTVVVHTKGHLLAVLVNVNCAGCCNG